MSETPFPVSAPPPDAASLAALLQSAAQALLRSGTSSEEHPAPAKVERIQEEISHYLFPHLAVRCERTVGSGRRRGNAGIAVQSVLFA